MAGKQEQKRKTQEGGASGGEEGRRGLGGETQQA